MSGVVHPVGPEPPRVYWLRRIIVLAAAALSLVLVIAIVVNLNSAASARGPQAGPAPADSTSAPAPDSGTPAQTSAAPTAAATSFSAAAGRSPAGSTSARATAGATSTDKPSGSTSPRSTAAKPKPTASTPAPEVAACTPGDLRPTLTGKQAVKVKTKTNLDLSLINGGPRTCLLTLNSDNFTLTIYSGRDRIWSTEDCPDLVEPVSVKIASEDAYEWRLVWNGLRSQKSCTSRPEVPRAGTYVAAAEFAGTAPVRFRMFLKN